MQGFCAIVRSLQAAFKGSGCFEVAWPFVARVVRVLFVDGLLLGFRGA